MPGVFVLRSLIERATRKSVFLRRLPKEYGGAPLFVSGSAGLKYLFRSMDRIEPELRSLAMEFVKPGTVVWDVGANVGLFAFSAAHHAGAKGRVVAFEPDAWLVQLLRRSAAIQPPASAPVQVVPVAVAASCDVRTFNLAVRSRAANYLSGYGSSSAGGVREEQTVLAASLDWLAERLPAPDVVKIDVEGAELEVLKGAGRLLGTQRPILLCEVSSANSAAVSALLRASGYRIFNADQPPASRVELAHAPWSTLAIADPRPAKHSSDALR
jgi:FkbM family methyltransferase